MKSPCTETQGFGVNQCREITSPIVRSRNPQSWDFFRFLKNFDFALTTSLQAPIPIDLMGDENFQSNFFYFRSLHAMELWLIIKSTVRSCSCKATSGRTYASGWPKLASPSPTSSKFTVSKQKNSLKTVILKLRRKRDLKIEVTTMQINFRI